MKKYFLLLSCFFFISAYKVNAQKIISKFSEEFYKSTEWRNIGPFRGGRSAAVTGVANKPNLYYFGATGGGVWKTTDAGNTWSNISDGFFGGSVGAVSVSESDPNTIYVGNGEKTIRGNVSSGDGMWKSVDAGKTWSNIGLKNSRHIPRVRIHPKNSEIVFAAVLGDIYKSSEERGIYKSIDGGKNWKRVLFSNANAGAIDLIIDPTNSRILYATTWNVRRTPYSLSSGGDGSSLWKSTDEGESWINISNNEGLPKGIWGISGVTVSPLNGDIVWALIENKDGGVYKSIDGGKTWKLFNSDRALRQRAWYYTRIYADTKDENTLYVVNVNYHQSKDGGKTFKSFNAPHGDHHDLWISPEDNQRMIIGDDGGAQISFDAGENWTTYHNQPTSQIYRITTDNHFPYRIYGAQQDNSTIRISHRTNGGTIGEQDWQETAGGESAHIAVDPLNNDIVYGGSYGGLLTRVNHKTDESRVINVWPDDPMGHGAEDMKYRFQWNYPIFFSPHNQKKMYTTSNHVHVTYNEGQSFEVISPDLTRNDPKTLGPSGGPITKDNTGVEYYGTIFAAMESPFEKNLIWTGSDDGLVHVTKDGGKNWSNVTPPKMPEWTMINCIEADPFTLGGAYIVGTRYKSGDYAPYIYKTEDYGKSWKSITNGIGSEHFTRTLRADPKRKGLLFSGTEKGMYVSFDDGLNWDSFQLNLPIVPITDLAIKNNNLIAATQGRSFWIIDDLTPFHQLNNTLISKDNFLFKPMDSYRMGGSSRTSKTAGKNHPGGVLINYFIKNLTEKDTVALTILDEKGLIIKTFSNKPNEEANEDELKVKQGSNTFNWDMQYPEAEKIKGMILWWASLNGPMALPGSYSVKLFKNKIEVSTQDFNIIKDPRSSANDDDLKTQFDFIIDIQQKLTDIHKTLKNITKIKEQISYVKKSISDKEKHKDILDLCKKIEESLTLHENELYQTKSKSSQDPLNFPIKLNNKLAHLNALSSIGDYKPTDQAITFKNELVILIDKELEKINSIFNSDIKELNKKVKESEINFINLK
ncbi:glycosyl hydrolase [Lutibacter sp.]|uniref:VPS10 domain-containing protein n=1 Tax=Lutibacter sp. TaxID=1925666 RepID=UPI0027347269|nr:glycosyl hydrolase [Lutibacter sp.]MDP3313393.1 glycosyl hydrolase [Lutibacter sp.]